MKSEIWKWVILYRKNKRISFKGYYKVSNWGRVKSIERTIDRKDGSILSVASKILKTPISTNRNNRYPYVTLYKNKRKFTACKVHNLMLWAFYGPCPEGMQCRHLNDEQTDNRWPENICWGTSKQNHADAKRNGRMGRATGEQNGNSKLAEFQIAKIRKLRKSGLSAVKVAEKFGVCKTTILNIDRGRCWK